MGFGVLDGLRLTQVEGGCRGLVCYCSRAEWCVAAPVLEERQK
jgi:hypothetical protein